MELLLRENRIRFDDGTYLDVQTKSAMAIYVVLAMEQLENGGKSTSAFEISRELRGTLSPATIKKILWEESGLNNREGILLIAERANYDNKKSNKPETGTRGGWTVYKLASTNIKTPLIELQDWLDMFIHMMQKGGSKNITLLRSADLALMNTYITEGRFKQAVMLYDSRDLRHIGRSISGKARQRQLVERDCLYGSLLMSKGEFRDAIHILKQAMIRAKGMGYVSQAAGAAGNLLSGPLCQDNKGSRLRW